MIHRSDQIYSIAADGWLPGVLQCKSPNCDARPAHEPIRLIVVHAISLPPGNFGGTYVHELFTNKLDADAHPYFFDIATRRVSAHFYIARDGGLTQFVSCHERAWHAGVSCWQGRDRCNDFSLGIELEGDDFTEFTAAQYLHLNHLVRSLCRAYPIEQVVGHADIAPGRKCDPGPHFDWHKLANVT